MTTSPLVRLIISNPTASGRREGWWKYIVAVDATKKDGFAFEGEFLREGENDLPVGAILVRQEPAGSVKNNYKTGTAYRVGPDGTLVEIAHCPDWRASFLSFRDAVAAAVTADEFPAEPVAEPAGDPPAVLLAEASDAQILAEARRRGLLA